MTLCEKVRYEYELGFRLEFIARRLGIQLSEAERYMGFESPNETKQYEAPEKPKPKKKKRKLIAYAGSDGRSTWSYQ